MMAVCKQVPCCPAVSPIKEAVWPIVQREPNNAHVVCVQHACTTCQLYGMVETKATQGPRPACSNT